MRHGQYPNALEDNLTRASQEQPDTGPARNAPTTPGGLAPAPGNRVQLPGINYFPNGAFPVDQVGAADIAGQSQAVVLSIMVPSDAQLRLDGIGFGADDENALGFLTWQLFENNVPTQEYGQVKSSAIGTILHPSVIHLHARGPNTIQLVLTNASDPALTYHFVARLKGWRYSEKEL